MGSAFWEPIYHNHAVTQYHNGRPLSVALTEPDEANFSILHPPARSQSVGRRVKRESSSYTFHYPQPMFPRAMNYVGSSGDMFVEKLETVTIEEEKQRPSLNGMLSHVRNCSPVVRQLKIRSRPSSSFNLHERDASTDQRWSKAVDEQHVEHYQYQYHYDFLPNRIIPIKRDSTPSSDDWTSVKQHRPIMKDSSTTTADLRKLSRSETQIIERFEKDEKIPSTTLNESISFDHRPSRSSSHAELGDTTNSLFTPYLGKQHRISIEPELRWKPMRTVTVFSDVDRNGVVVRPTAKPREALVDTASIVAPPTDTPDPLEPNARRRYFLA